MTFVILFACLVAERFLLSYESWRQPLWYESWMELQQSLPVPAALRQGSLGLMMLWLPPLCAVVLAQYLLADALGGIPWALLSALILLYSLGPRDLDSEVSALVEAGERGDITEAKRLTRALAGALPGHDAAFQDRELVACVLAAALPRIFAVLFWFLLLGPAGALGYRLAWLSEHLARRHARPGLQEPAAGLLRALEWLPARLLAGLYALGGCFDTAVQGWRHCDADSSPGTGHAVVICAGTGAMQLDTVASREADSRGPDGFLLEAAMALVWRALVIFIALLGLATVSGWLL